ncbi:unnamed protein product [Merluccius merluccius]
MADLQRTALYAEEQRQHLPPLRQRRWGPLLGGTDSATAAEERNTKSPKGPQAAAAVEVIIGHHGLPQARLGGAFRYLLLPPSSAHLTLINLPVHLPSLSLASPSLAISCNLIHSPVFFAAQQAVKWTRPDRLVPRDVFMKSVSEFKLQLTLLAKKIQG